MIAGRCDHRIGALPNPSPVVKSFICLLTSPFTSMSGIITQVGRDGEYNNHYPTVVPNHQNNNEVRRTPFYKIMQRYQSPPSLIFSLFALMHLN